MSLLQFETVPPVKRRALHRESRIAVVIPHYQCEQWLGDCLRSIVEQTRQPDAIIVVDDGSPHPPTDIVREFEGVTLLQSVENVGWERVLQQAIDDTEFDGYMIQDADDWSGPRRLEWLLEEADRTGAQYIGCQEMRIDVADMEAEPHWYPADVNGTIRAEPGAYALLHPTSIVARELVTSLGGYPTGMRFAGDAEFQRRAVHVALVRNIPSLCYFRRTRPGALTTAPETGDKSPARAAVRRTLIERSERAVARAKNGEPVDLKPMVTAPPISLHHLLGPDVRTGQSAVSENGRMTATRTPSAGDKSARPVFVVGAPHSGVGYLHGILAQHPHFVGVSGIHFRSSVVESEVRQMGRIVDGGPSYSFQLHNVLTRFPDAVILHVVVNPVDLIHKLIARNADADATTIARETLDSWIRHVGGCLNAELKFGRSSVRRIDGDALMRRPEETVRGVLRDLAEPFVASCLRGFVTEAPAPVTPAAIELHEGIPEFDATMVAARVVWEDYLRGAPPPETTPGLPTMLSFVFPPTAKPLVLSHGDDMLIDFGKVKGHHFPRYEDGSFSSEIFMTSEDVIAALEQERVSGATHLVVPRAAFWWLAHYTGLKSYIETNSALFGFFGNEGMVFRFNAR